MVFTSQSRLVASRIAYYSRAYMGRLLTASAPCAVSDLRAGSASYEFPSSLTPSRCTFCTSPQHHKLPERKRNDNRRPGDRARRKPGSDLSKPQPTIEKRYVAELARRRGKEPGIISLERLARERLANNKTIDHKSGTKPDNKADPEKKPTTRAERKAAAKAARLERKAREKVPRHPDGKRVMTNEEIQKRREKAKIKALRHKEAERVRNLLPSKREPKEDEIVQLEPAESPSEKARREQDSTEPDSTDATPLPRPEPSRHYLVTSSTAPIILPNPRRLFVVLDLHRTLVARPRFAPQIRKRPQLEEFMDVLLREHNGMLWTSARTTTLSQHLPRAFHGRVRRKLCAIWDRRMFGLNQSQYHAQIQVYKDLSRVWERRMLQRMTGEMTREARKKLKQAKVVPGFWNEGNTVSIDDDPAKGAQWPWNTLLVPPMPDSGGRKDSTLKTVLRQLRVLAWYKDVRPKIKEWTEMIEKKHGRNFEGEVWMMDQRQYDMFWGPVLQEEEEKLGLDKYVFPPVSEGIRGGIEFEMEDGEEMKWWTN